MMNQSWLAQPTARYLMIGLLALLLNACASTQNFGRQVLSPFWACDGTPEYSNGPDWICEERMAKQNTPVATPQPTVATPAAAPAQQAKAPLSPSRNTTTPAPQRPSNTTTTRPATVATLPTPTATNASSSGLLRQPSSNYTIQLIAAKSAQPLQAFAQKHQLRNWEIVPTRRNGNTWQILLAGVYPSRGAAEAAVPQLPPGVLSSKPWVRRIGDIRKITILSASSTPNTTATQVPRSAAARNPQPSATAAPKARAAGNGSVAQKILSQPKNNYTLQLMASKQANSLATFARENRLANALTVATETAQGNRWHVLVIGSFPDRESAIRASRNLPAAVRAQEPRVRSYASLQQELVD